MACCEKIVVFVCLCGMIYLLHAAPLARRMVDMTYTFDEKINHFPIVNGFKKDVVLNGTGMGNMWWLAEDYSASVHLGTHMDAPAHTSPTGLTVDQLPLHHLIAPAAVIDITAKAELDPDAEITVEDLLNWESITGHTLNETIVLMKSGWGKKWNNQTAYLGSPDLDISNAKFPGLAPEAATWLIENRNIYGYGTDAVHLDKGSRSDTFPVHQTLLPNNVFGLENVANVDQIPIYGATLYVMPMKIGGGSGAPTRIIATYPEVIYDTLLSRK
ncbi:isatin hydrolase-like [Argiope bruennichi]|uniref:isatin hydrolase-like n=1 Tax=Argiope bruennichi TaxID=94029 RepID=UPI0024951309|nr:isatin hydrolase-like [Argiope bruennichi]